MSARTFRIALLALALLLAGTAAPNAQLVIKASDDVSRPIQLILFVSVLLVRKAAIRCKVYDSFIAIGRIGQIE